MIGIGITTRNRPHVLRSALEHFALFHTVENKYVVIDDNSDIENDCAEIVSEFRAKVNAEVIVKKSEQRLGIALAKNACLAELSDCEHVFLFDDDAWPQHENWSTLWINACSSNNVHHSMYCIQLSEDNDFFEETGKLGSGETEITGWSNCLGVALYFSRKCLKKLGGYDYINAKNVYGYEHAQMSKRAFNAGMTGGFAYASPSFISDWIYSADMSWGWKKQLPPLEASWLENFSSSVSQDESSKHEDNAMMMINPKTYIELVNPLQSISDKKMNSKINVVIPTKSNFSGLFELLDSMSMDQSIGEIVVIADGSDAYNYLLPKSHSKFTLLMVPLASGLHKMWNMGMEHFRGSGKHLAIINDDVVLSENALSIASDLLDSESEIGLVTPWSDKNITDRFIETSGFAGFCMVIASDLVDVWRFDERMMWWYGDTDVITWVNVVAKRKTGLTGLCHATGNKSETITTNPPPNFHADIHNDARLYHEKWTQNKENEG
jgi:glycosyltransferase involved in cell wall biosynthesis